MAEGDGAMRNGYFRLVNDSMGYGISLIQPVGCGEEIRLDEILKYLDGQKISYDRKRLEMDVDVGIDTVCHLGSGACPIVDEVCYLEADSDGMVATVRFIPPSENGARLTFDGFLDILDQKKIVYGRQLDAVKEHFASEGIYCTEIVVAKGEEAVPGVDAQIEYHFNTETHRRPVHKDDGRVDYFNLSTISFCRKGDVLAHIIPEQPGVSGSDIYGKVLRPKDAKKETLKCGKNTELSEDKMTLIATADGHVSIANGKVVVANVYQVKSVDTSTGNIDFEGSVEVAGNVAANFEIKAGGNVVVNGYVESARIIAGGSIVIAKGMNGMGNGYLRAGGDVMVKFLENVRVVAGGYLEADAILHCTVSAGSDVKVDGKRGMIAGGYVQAANTVVAKTIGASMGTLTTVEVGIKPLIKSQFDRIQKALDDNVKTTKAAQTVLDNFKDKQQRGVQYNDRQLKYMRSVATLVQEKSAEAEQLNVRLERLKAMMETQKKAEVVVSGQVYPGSTIIVGDASKPIQNICRYCKFIREDGEVRLVPL